MVSKLQPIPYDIELTAFDLSQTEPCDDRLITELHLSDYDWMDYKFIVYLPTKTQGFLTTKMEYFGTITSEMIVEQTLSDKEKYTHKIVFDTHLFVNFIKRYMKAHLEQWDSTYAFCGEAMAVEFFNTIINNHLSYQIEPHENEKGEQND